jgi:hypothetical protein
MDPMTDDAGTPRLKPGYDVWFGMQHVTLTGFRHSGRRRDCPKCNPALRPAEEDPGLVERHEVDDAE